MTYSLITDGSVISHASCGGWAFILQGVGHEKQRAGVLWGVEVNIVELWAIVEGLSVIPRPSDVTVFTDSYYVINGFKKDKYSKDLLWRELRILSVVHNISFTKVGKGRSDPRHTKVHHLAREQAFNAVSKTRPERRTRFGSGLFKLQDHSSRRRKSRRCKIDWRESDFQITGTD